MGPLCVAALILGAPPTPGALPTAPAPAAGIPGMAPLDALVLPSVDVPRAVIVPVPGVGPHLARKLRTSRDPVSALARGVTAERARAAGARVIAELGPILALELPGAAAARALARAGGELELPQPLRPTLDVSRMLVGADQTDFAEGFDAPLRGSGAIVGLYDSGLDLFHPDLRRLDGRTRVIAAWDQDSQERCDAARIDAGACPIGDVFGHGTHVGSIAAGSGPLHRGIAPEADLAIVRSSNFDAFVPALVFLDDASKALGRPLVVNLSLGGHVGPHDGTSMESEAIDAFPHLSVVAAGNEAGEAVHAGATLGMGAPIDVALELGPFETSATVDVWGAPDASLAIALIAVRNGRVVWSSGAVGPGSAAVDVEITIDASRPPLGRVELDAEPEKNRKNGRPHAAMLVRATPPTDARLALRVTGSGRFDAWIDAPADIDVVPRFSASPVLGLPSEIIGDDTFSISDLATARRALSVSALISRAQLAADPGDGTGGLAPFSSRGPSLDPVRTGPKPELTAPGGLVIAAASRTARLDGPLYQARAGTSMAVPHVAGAAAVLLGHDPGASPDALRSWLVESASEPPDDDARWGSGVLDLARAAEAAGAPTSGCGCATTGSASPAWAWVIVLAAAGRRRR